MVLFEYCAAFAMPMREKTAQLLSFCIELDIKGKNTESNSPNKGLITFDIIFDAISPVDGKPVKIIVNPEPQKTTRKIHYKFDYHKTFSKNRCS